MFRNGRLIDSVVSKLEAATVPVLCSLFGGLDGGAGFTVVQVISW